MPKRAIYLGEKVRGSDGMTEEESRPLIDYLNRHATQAEFVYRHQWRSNDIILWDNRSQGIMTGIGFLGAGVIGFFEYRASIRTRNAGNVKSLSEALSQNRTVREFSIRPTGD